MKLKKFNVSRLNLNMSRNALDKYIYMLFLDTTIELILIENRID